MSNKLETKNVKDHSTHSQKIGSKAARKLKAKENPAPDIWFGLGMMGLIGWSVVVPTMLGAGLGYWIDKNQIGSYSWTLMFLVVGLVLGCLNAWHWVANENKEIHEDKEDIDE